MTQTEAHALLLNSLHQIVRTRRELPARATLDRNDLSSFGDVFEMLAARLSVVEDAVLALAFHVGAVDATSEPAEPPPL